VLAACQNVQLVDSTKLHGFHHERSQEVRNFHEEKRQSQLHRVPKKHVTTFLADRTNGRAYATVLRLSVVCL